MHIEYSHKIYTLYYIKELEFKFEYRSQLVYLGIGIYYRGA